MTDPETLQTNHHTASERIHNAAIIAAERIVAANEQEADKQSGG